jgi:hypothetical protein
MTIEYYAIIDNQASEPYKSIQDLVEDYQIMLQQDIDTFGYYNDISVDSLYQITDEAFDFNNYCQEVLTIKEETERENELLMAEFSPYALNH